MAGAVICPGVAELVEIHSPSTIRPIGSEEFRFSLMAFLKLTLTGWPDPPIEIVPLLTLLKAIAPADPAMVRLPSRLVCRAKMEPNEPSVLISPTFITPLSVCGLMDNVVAEVCRGVDGSMEAVPMSRLPALFSVRLPPERGRMRTPGR